MSRVIEVAQGVYQLTTVGAAVTVVVDGEQVVVLDAGMRSTTARVLALLEQLGLRPEQVTHILVTHHHPDHIGGLLGLQQATGALVAAHPGDTAVIQGDVPFPSPFVHKPLELAFGGLLRLMDPRPTPVELPLTHDDVIEVAGGIRIIHTPGHTQGSLSFLFPERGLLFVGDALQRRFGRLDWPDPMYTWDMAAARRSVVALSELDFDVLAFSHFPVVRGGGRAELQHLAAGVA